uniref:Uncharacterized protein n=1 Tax=Arundo donax TaxID=35708 RepID=A0A0A9E1D6_ARUDO
MTKDECILSATIISEPLTELAKSESNPTTLIAGIWTVGPNLGNDLIVVSLESGLRPWKTAGPSIA